VKTAKVDIRATGLVCSVGGNVQDTFVRMCAGEDGFREITRFPSDVYAQGCGGQIDDDLEETLRNSFPDDDLAAALVKSAGLEAMANPTFNANGELDLQLGLVLATNFGAMESLEWCWRERIDDGGMDGDTFAMYDGFIQNIGNFFNCGGPRVQLSLSCASGAAAVALGKDWLNGGRVQRVLVIAYDCLTEFCWSGLSNLHTISTDALRPFDSKRSGTIFSEGAAAMLLENQDLRVFHKQPPLAELCGAASNNNAFHMTAPSKDAEGSRLVMLAALQDAGVLPEQIEHICAHATGTVANDRTEVAAFRNLFGDYLQGMSIAAHKSQLGHMMGGAGLAEAIVTVEALRQGKIPPTINNRETDPECMVNFVREETLSKKFTLAITNSAGLGGNNSSLVIKSIEQEK